MLNKGFQVIDNVSWIFDDIFDVVQMVAKKLLRKLKKILKGDYKPQIRMEIKQTWNKIQVNGISEYNTQTASESAYILEQHGIMYFGYSYQIHHLDEEGQQYSGFNSLRIDGDRMIGQYFSAKDVTNEFEKACVGVNAGKESREIKKMKQKVKDCAKGCGSKGIITFYREC